MSQRKSLDLEKNKERETPLSDDTTVWSRLRRLIFGAPIASAQHEESRLPKILALPIFCSDAISSVAYGGQQILLVLCLAGLWQPQYFDLFQHNTMLVTSMIVGVLSLVAVSYFQTIFAYPGGGGSYVVTKDNLGTWPGLVAASAILIDYVLCVAVSIASGMQNLKDVPLLAPLHITENMVYYCVAAVLVMVWLNLRGLREPGLAFAGPVYIFIAMCYLMIALGLGAETFHWTLHREYANQSMPTGLPLTVLSGAFGISIILRAFASGCSALTGVEAVSDGIPAFRAPQQRNAAIVLLWMALILGSIFTGVSLLAVKFHIVYWELHGHSAPAVIDQLSGTVFGKTGASSALYYITQFSTALILMVAAQTSFADFPRVCWFLARDGFMPRQLANLGDRLAFDNGILILGFLATLFLVAEKGSVDLLIPFFTIGVFLAFTLSQSGMVVRWFKLKTKGWMLKAVLNGIGALATFVVLLDVVVEKFFEGAWFVLVCIGLLLFVFKKINGHYRELSQKLQLLEPKTPLEAKKNTVLVLVQGVHAGTMNAVSFAQSISSELQAVYVEIDPVATENLKLQWSKLVPGVPLVVLESPYRSLIHPIMHYLDELERKLPDRMITVVIGEFVSDKWWHSLLHGNTGLLLKLAFLSRRDVVVANVRYWLT